MLCVTIKKVVITVILCFELSNMNKHKNERVKWRFHKNNLWIDSKITETFRIGIFDLERIKNFWIRTITFRVAFLYGERYVLRFLVNRRFLFFFFHVYGDGENISNNIEWRLN